MGGEWESTVAGGEASRPAGGTQGTDPQGGRLEGEVKGSNGTKRHTRERM